MTLKQSYYKPESSSHATCQSLALLLISIKGGQQRDSATHVIQECAMQTDSIISLTKTDAVFEDEIFACKFLVRDKLLGRYTKI